MKKIVIAISCVIAFSLTSCKEIKNVPTGIKSQISTKYPGISNLDWDQEKDGSWEAEFKNNGIKTTVSFLANGSIKEVEEEIALSDFPVTAQQYLNQKYLGKKIKDISKMTDAQGLVTYEAEVDDLDLIFDAQGNFLKFENENEKEGAVTPTVVPIEVKNKLIGKVDISTIPQSVKDFVNKNYPDYKIENAEHDPMCNGDDAIDVAIRKPGSPAFSVIFSPKWEFIQQEEDVDFGLAPAKIKETLKNKFSD